MQKMLEVEEKEGAREARGPKWSRTRDCDFRVQRLLYINVCCLCIPITQGDLSIHARNVPDRLFEIRSKTPPPFFSSFSSFLLASFSVAPDNLSSMTLLQTPCPILLVNIALNRPNTSANATSVCHLKNPVVPCRARRARAWTLLLSGRIYVTYRSYWISFVR